MALIPMKQYVPHEVSMHWINEFFYRLGAFGIEGKGIREACYEYFSF